MNYKTYTFRHAAEVGDVLTVLKELRKGVDVHAMQDAALRNAAAKGHIDVVKLLLEFGADPSARDYEAERVATMGGHRKVALMLANHSLKMANG